MEQTLPIYAQAQVLIDTIRDNPITVVTSETGSGKTTVLPRLLLSAGFAQRGMIGVAEPRRIAATSVADYVASLFGEKSGGIVGHQIRNEKMVDDRHTKIKYMTCGVLLREYGVDPRLSKYAVLFIDEFHERNVEQEFLATILRELSRTRPDLRIVIMSATIDVKRTADYFRAKVVHVIGRQHPVLIEYAEDDISDPIEAAAGEAIMLAYRVKGDILVFVPDYDAIEKVIADLQNSVVAKQMFDGFLPLYGNQSPAEHRAIFARKGRYVLVATNVAETSITPVGVHGCVDTGQFKEMSYFPDTGHSALVRRWHSQAGCNQRAGRVGRTEPGICVRLFTKERFDKMKPFTTPEILRSDLSQVCLQLISAGQTFGQIVDMPLMARPGRNTWVAAKRTLVALGAMDADSEGLTVDGHTMSQIPLPPAMAKMVIAAAEYDCLPQVAFIAAKFVTHRVFLRPPGRRDEATEKHLRFADKRSDFVALYRAYRAWDLAPDPEVFAEEHLLHHEALMDIKKTAEQLLAMLAGIGIVAKDIGFMPDRIGMAVAAGLSSMNLLKYSPGKNEEESRKGFYLTPNGERVAIFPGSFLYGHNPPKWLVAAELVYTRKLYALDCQVVEDSWLERLPRRDAYTEDEVIHSGRHGTKRRKEKKKPQARKEKKDRFLSRR